MSRGGLKIARATLATSASTPQYFNTIVTHVGEHTRARMARGCSIWLNAGTGSCAVPAAPPSPGDDGAAADSVTKYGATAIVSAAAALMRRRRRTQSAGADVTNTSTSHRTASIAAGNG